MSTPVGIFVVLFFDHHFITGGTLNATHPSEVRLKAASNSKVITPGGYHSPTTRTGTDTGIGMEAHATPHHSGIVTEVVVTNQCDSYGIHDGTDILCAGCGLERKLLHQVVISQCFNETRLLRCNSRQFCLRMLYP